MRDITDISTRWEKCEIISSIVMKKGVHSCKLAMNEFGDLLHQEFVSNMNGYKETERIDGAKFLGSIFEI